MKFVYKILLGMVLFNAMILFTSSYFQYTPLDNPLGSENVTNIVDSDISSYGKVDSLWGIITSTFATGAIGYVIIGFFVLASGVVGWFTGGAKNVPMAMGIGLLFGIIISLWTSTIRVFTSIGNSFGLTVLFSIVSIGIGIAIVYLVIDILTGSSRGG